MFYIFDSGALGKFIVMVVNGRMSSIPSDPANTDYQAYLAWVAEGNTAEEWNPQG